MMKQVSDFVLDQVAILRSDEMRGMDLSAIPVGQRVFGGFCVALGFAAVFAAMILPVL